MQKSAAERTRLTPERKWTLRKPGVPMATPPCPHLATTHSLVNDDAKARARPLLIRHRPRLAIPGQRQNLEHVNNPSGPTRNTRLPFRGKKKKYHLCILALLISLYISSRSVLSGPGGLRLIPAHKSFRALFTAILPASAAFFAARSSGGIRTPGRLINLITVIDPDQPLCLTYSLHHHCN